MRPTYIFCTSVILAILIVIFLALFSPIPHKSHHTKNPNPWLSLSLYIQQPVISTPNTNTNSPTPSDAGGAFIFHRTLTEGPDNTSRPVGKAQGFIVPVEKFAHSDFNIVYLTFDTPDFAGSLSVEARHVEYKDREELTVVGGTGSFAFARGLAVFARTDRESSYHVKLQLRFPDRSRIING